MTNNSKTFFILAVILAGAMYSNGCAGGSGAAVQTMPINVSMSPAGAQLVDQGQSKQFTANVSNDSANKGVSWSLTQNGSSCAPGCGTISPANTASGAATTYSAPATVNANVQFSVTATLVADSSKSAFDSTTAVPPPALNNPAQLSVATVGQPYSYTLTEAGGVPPFTWSITSGSLPAGLTLNSPTGVISGTPTAASQAVPGSMKPAAAQPNATPSGFIVQGCDSGNPQLCSSQQLSIGVIGGIPNYTISASPASLVLKQGDNGTVTITVNPINDFNSSVSLAASGLPNGVVAAFNPASTTTTSTLTLTAGPAAALGAVSVTVTGTASTTGLPSQTTSILLTVSTSLTVTSPNFFGGTIGTQFGATATASGGVPPYAWSAGPLPAGLSVDAKSGVISGIPNGPVGETDADVQVKDSSSPIQTATQFLKIVIGTKLAISANPLPNGTVGTTYSSGVVANGGISPLQWSLAAGSLPAGLSLDPKGGVISGTPTTVGAANFTVQVMDNSSPPEKVTQQLSIAINPANPKQFTFGRTSLPDGRIGAAYDQTLSTVNGNGAVTITLASGTLPAGLSLSANGTISGTPLGPNGTSSFTLQATDSSTPAQVVQQNFSISITDVGACVFDSSGFGPPNSNANLKGAYVYRFQGFDANGNAVARLGEFTADGSEDRNTDQAFGHITGVIEDSATTAGGGTYQPSAHLANSTYCIGGNSNTSAITLGAVHYRIGVTGVGNLGGADDDISFIEFDATDKVRGSGVMRLQKSATITQTGNVTYVFGMSGRDNSQSTNLPMTVVGQFTVDPTLLPVPGLSGLKGDEDLSEASIRGKLGPGFYRTISGSLNASTDSSGNPIPGRYTGQIVADPSPTPGDIGSGSIDFVAYVVKAASGAPTSKDSTELLAISTGASPTTGLTTPAGTVLSGEIVSQNFATNSTFNNSATPNTPDARAMSAQNFYIMGGLIDDIPNTVAYADAATKSVVLVGFVSFDGSRKPAATVGNVVQLESDTDAAGNVQAPSQLPAPATYQVKPTGAVTFTSLGGLLPETVLYLSDIDTGFAIVDDPQLLLAGFGRVMPSRNPGAGIVPVQTVTNIGDLPIQVPGSATTVGTASPVFMPGGPITGVKIVQDVDDPSAGLVPASQLGEFPITPTDAFGRFTVGACPAPAQNVVAPCFVGYYQFLNPDGGGALILDETTAGFDSATTAPPVRVWGFVP